MDTCTKSNKDFDYRDHDHHDDCTTTATTITANNRNLLTLLLVEPYFLPHTPRGHTTAKH